MSDVMRKFVQEPKCKREMILHHFGHKMPKRDLPDHTCCDFHWRYCECDDCVVNSAQNNEDTPMKSKYERNVNDKHLSICTCSKTSLTDIEKVALHDALVNYRLSLHGSGPSCVGGVSLATGFSVDLIDMIVQNAKELTSIEEIKEKLPIFDDEHAKNIFAILSELNRGLEHLMRHYKRVVYTTSQTNMYFERKLR
ncbi:uncharacterized protein LOC114533377 [Dendronephthya gigantea]|uniref:uncharacterized protein LOC114533357 n=1 Tax=Dendronephthya gigantea TaxID=151771 RepID=UPI00106C9499|nr:uncharacterized protein LOC114533357 [Dendronephthya gigantea]XP_028410689.1 uncharacterized protein LOC114533377 [Dendronephthya gigantea]